MRSSLVVTSLVLAGTLAAPIAAQAAADPWSCRASAARTAPPAPAPAVEPIRANAGLAPCSTQSSAVLEPGPVGPATAGAVGAFTSRASDGASSALASAATPQVTLGPLTVSAEEVHATAAAACSGKSPVLSGTSRVVGLVINGQPAVLPPDDAPFSIPLGPLGTVEGNQEIKDEKAGTLTRRALAVVTPSGEAVFAEAIAGATPAACKPATAPATIRSACPSGSTYDAQHNACLIVRPGAGTNTTTVTTVVSQPFQGPQGAGVMSLAEARKKFKSPCLRRNKGPKFVIVGTDKSNRIKGTRRDDRIILRGGKDRASGGRGSDCIDGGKGRDAIYGGVGKDSLYGKKGNDRLIGGKGADHLSGAGGNDKISAGKGRGTIQGGKGRDRINASKRGPATKWIRCGPGRDRARVNRNERRKAKRGSCNRIRMVR